MNVESRESTPIDDYIESRRKNIYINISRVVFKSSYNYTISVEGTKSPHKIENLTREACYQYAIAIYNRHRAERVILNNRYSKTSIRNFTLCKILAESEYNERLDKMFETMKRSERKFGKIPAKAIKGFKRPNPVSMPPIEKQW